MMKYVCSAVLPVVVFMVLGGMVPQCSAKENLKRKISFHRDEFPDSLLLHLTNPLNASRIDEAIFVDIVSIQRKFSHFNPGACCVYEGLKELPSQVDDTNRDGLPDLLTFVVNFGPKETKTIVVKYDAHGSVKRAYVKRTQADLGIKVDYEFVDGKYTKGRFVTIDSVRVPDVHVDHDALFRHEGPGWESDKVGYRFYLDARNRTDIFGKKIPDMVLHTVGVHDLVADNNESYESMMSWGMDNFKVGTSLGIGSIAMEQGKDIVTVSKTDSVFCVIASNGPVRSDVQAKYYGWNVDGQKYTLTSSYSITAGSHCTRCEDTVDPLPANLCTGLAKHEETVLVEPPGGTKGNWRYLGLFGKQSRADDHMGIAVFYENSERIERREDEASHIIVLRPRDGKLIYYFASTWEQEPNGIKTIEGFRSYLESVVLRLDNPIEVQF